MRILIHGLGQTPENWYKTISFMKSNDIICPDLCSILNNSDKNYDNLYTGFADYLNKINEPHDLCGLSLGSVLALNYAIDYPDKVSSLVLIAPQYKMPVNLLKFQNFIFKLMPSSSFRQTGFAKNDFIELCQSMVHIDFSDCLNKVSCRVMIICGENDRANRKSSVNLSENLKNSELVIIKNCGHEVNSDVPEKLAEILNRFYNK